MSTNDPARRGFLRGLVSLPLIGGGVTLIGNPTAAAVPVSVDLLNSYDTWLEMERRCLKVERYGTTFRNERDRFVLGLKDRETGQVWDYTPASNGGDRFHFGGHGAPAPSTRAAVVLSAVGCDWRETGL